MTDDNIQIIGLAASTVLGVPEEERAQPQKVKFNITLWPENGLAGLADDFSRTVDYDAAAQWVRKTAESGGRKLLETLAEDTASALLERFPLRRVCVEVLKFILPDTEAVAVRITRERQNGGSA